jgi:hypothetical protein
MYYAMGNYCNSIFSCAGDRRTTLRPYWDLPCRAASKNAIVSINKFSCCVLIGCVGTVLEKISNCVFMESPQQTLKSVA